MKIRTGFVSNSSSSSFVVLFPHDPKSARDLKDMMFGSDETFEVSDIYRDEPCSSVKTQDMANVLWQDISKLTPITLSKDLPPLSQLEHLGYNSGPEIQTFLQKLGRELDKNNGSVVYSFVIDDGSEKYMNGIMEHEEIFHDLLHMQFSNH